MISKEKAVKIIYNTFREHNITISNWDFSYSDNVRCNMMIGGEQHRFRFSLNYCFVEQCQNGILVSNEISYNIQRLIHDKWY